MRTLRVTAPAVALALAVACAPASTDVTVDAPAPVATVTTATPTPTSAPATAAASPSPRAFRGEIRRIDAALARRMRHSWRQGCPVPLRDLRYLTLDYWGFDDRPRRGELVVHRDVAAKVLRAFERIYDARFPIRRMRLVDEYGGSDARSMRADNTSAFNCRSVTGRPGVWSQHSYGRAIDINPIENPYVRGGSVDPPEGRRYANRSLRAKGMIKRGDAVVRAFTSIGWIWGGTWRSGKDYQHFSANGR